jgi:hypothetical protein
LEVLSRFHGVLRVSLESHPLLAAHLASQALILEHGASGAAEASLGVRYRALHTLAAAGGAAADSVTDALSASLDALLNELLDSAAPFRDGLVLHRCDSDGEVAFEVRPRSSHLDEPGTILPLVGGTGDYHKKARAIDLLMREMFPGQTLQLLPAAAATAARVRLHLRESDADVLPLYCGGGGGGDESVFAMLRAVQCAAADGEAPLPALTALVQSGGGDETFASSTRAHFTLRSGAEVHASVRILADAAAQG